VRDPDAQTHSNPLSLRVKAYTQADGKVCIHPKSVNAEETNFNYSWLIYHLKMRTSSVSRRGGGGGGRPLPVFQLMHGCRYTRVCFAFVVLILYVTPDVRGKGEAWFIPAFL